MITGPTPLDDAWARSDRALDRKTVNTLTSAALPDDVRKLLDNYERRILLASGRISDVAEETPLEAAPKLSARLGNRIWIKREDLQPVFSFKLRGAYNCIAALSEEQRSRGVVTASAGNHAQGVALSGTRLGIATHIVMPRTTPSIKVDSVRGLGGNAILHGDSYDDALAHALELVEQQGLTLVHPYDDADVIAGQGTIGREILEQFQRQADRLPDVVFVPVGGGGLIAGIAAWIKRHSPQTRIVSVEPEDSDCFAAAMRHGRRVKLAQAGLFADGVSVRQIGEEPFRVARHLVDDTILVSIDEICTAIRDVFYDRRALPEPAGALAVAGARKWVLEHGARDLDLCTIVSGANVNFDRLRYIAERAEFGDESEALLAVTLDEKRGAYQSFLHRIGRRALTEFNYRYSSPDKAHVFAGIKLSGGRAEREQLLAELRADGYAVVDMSGNDLAKVHIRYMVGGRSPGLADEHLFRFEFPERPGACLEFLTAISERWNISLFHYRNHGSAFGRVLCGLQVPYRERGDLRRSLEALGYPHWDESQNPAYGLFLGTRDD